MLISNYFCYIFQVNNNCSTGSTALLLAKQMIEGGNANCVLALGFEKMEKGSLKSEVSAVCYSPLRTVFFL